MNLAENLRQLRKARGLTQAQLARVCGITESYICRLERGKETNPSLNTMIRLSTILGVSLDLLVGRISLMEIAESQLQPLARMVLENWAKLPKHRQVKVMKIMDVIVNQERKETR